MSEIWLFRVDQDSAVAKGCWFDGIIVSECSARFLTVESYFKGCEATHKEASKLAHAVNAFITELVNIHNYYHTFLKGGGRGETSEVPRSDPEFLTSMKRTDDPMNMITGPSRSGAPRSLFIVSASVSREYENLKIITNLSGRDSNEFLLRSLLPFGGLGTRGFGKQFSAPVQIGLRDELRAFVGSIRLAMGSFM